MCQKLSNLTRFFLANPVPLFIFFFFQQNNANYQAAHNSVPNIYLCVEVLFYLMHPVISQASHINRLIFFLFSFFSSGREEGSVARILTIG